MIEKINEGVQRNVIQKINTLERIISTEKGLLIKRKNRKKKIDITEGKTLTKKEEGKRAEITALTKRDPDPEV